MFAGWTGACNGTLTMTVNVNSVEPCGASFVSGSPGIARTILFWDSAPGEFIGGGDPQVYTLANSIWSVTAPFGNAGITFRVTSIGDRSDWSWNLQFTAPLGSTLEPGTYQIGNSVAGEPGLDISGNGRGCSPAGTFTIHDFVLSPFNGAVTAFAADFDFHCNSMSSPALIGTLRFNSTVPIGIRSVSLAANRTLPSVINNTITWTAATQPDRC